MLHMDLGSLSRRDFVGLCGAAALSPISVLAPGAKVSERVVAGGPDDFMIVRHVRVEGTNRQIGSAITELARENHGVRKLASGSPASVAARKAFFAKRYPELYARARGAADVLGGWFDAGVDPFGIGYDGMSQPGCSTVYYPPSSSANGHAMLSRNYDFSTATLADLVGQTPKPKDRAFTADPYLLEIHPDKGYPSLYLTSYDLLSGCVDGINSEGLTVALLADDVSSGKRPSPEAMPGLGEIEVTRYLLDRCATVPEAIRALRDMPYYYTFIPCHYIVGDRRGRSFVWEHGVPDNRPHVVRGDGRPQIVTNHLLSEFSDPEKRIEPFAGGSFNRYCRMRDQLAKHHGPLGKEEMKRINQSVQARWQGQSGQRILGRTLWHSLYDLQSRTLEVSFYLGEGADAPRRSPYLKFGL
jgi:hypothetical protein